MVLSWIKKQFTEGVPRQNVHILDGAKNAPATPSPSVQTIYPPEDPGLPVRSSQFLVDGNESLLSRIKLHAATDTGRYDYRYLQPVLRLAEHINTLPATATGLFSGEGGLFRACVELAFLSFQASDGRIFTGTETVERRHKLEPRWRYICFIAGLLYPIGRPLGRMTVTSASGAAWQRHHYGLTEWASASGVDRMYVSWSDEKSPLQTEPIGPSPYTASILQKIIGSDNLAWLEEGSQDLTRAVFEIVSGNETTAKIAKDVISTVWTKVQQREESRRPQTYGRLTIGTHLAPYLVGAMRNLVEAGGWKPNVLPLIVDATGIYLVWPKAGEDLVRQGAAENHDGWPSSASVLSELMKSAGIFDTSRANDMGMAEVIDGEGEVHGAFKLKSPNSVLESYDPREYVKQAPKTLEAILEKDPLVKTEAASKKQAAPAALASSDEAGAQPESVDSRPENSVGIEPKPVPVQAKNAVQGELAVEPAARAVRADKKVASAKETVPPGKVSEVPEVKYGDLVPEEIKKEMKTPLAVELLGKVVKAWRDRGEDSTTMRMTDNGAAIGFEFLTSLVRNVPDWVNEIAGAGLIYSPASTPGLKVQKVAIPEGSKPREAIVISRYGCKKLGL